MYLSIFLFVENKFFFFYSPQIKALLLLNFVAKIYDVVLLADVVLSLPLAIM